MSNYLWNKEGNDEEIVSLEEKLGAFSSKASKKVVLEPTENESLFQKVSRFWKLTPIVAAVLVLGVFLVIPGEERIESASAGSGIKETLTSPLEQVGTERRIEESEIQVRPLITKVSVASRPAKSTKRFQKRMKRPTRSKARKSHAKKKKAVTKPLESFTAEELAAYEQLKRALAITSSNLSILKEKVNGEKEAGKPETK